MDAGVAFIPAGITVDNLLPGDVILTHGSTWQAKLIQFGQALRFGKRASSFNHAALVVSDQGELIEAESRGVETGLAIQYKDEEFVLIRVPMSDEDRQQMIDYATSALGKRYGFATILSLALSLITGLKFNFGVDGQLICSSLVAHALFKGWEKFDRSLDNITPADLAQHFGIEEAN